LASSEAEFLLVLVPFSTSVAESTVLPEKSIELVS
jgi:hypothetical protein